MRSALASPQLRRLIAAYTINRLGTWFGVVALSLAVYDHTHSALAVAALLFAGQALPAFAVPAIIARVEASRRGRELSSLYLFEAVATASLAVLLWHFWLPAILLLVALDGSAALAASGLLRAAVARVARDRVEDASEPSPEGGQPGWDNADRRDARLEERAEDAARNANAALNLAFTATFVLGPVLGGAIVASAGAPAALFIDVASFLACGTLLLDLRAHVEDADGDSVRARLRAALTHVRQAPALRALLLMDAVALVFFTSAGPVEVAYAKATLHAGDRGYGAGRVGDVNQVDEREAFAGDEHGPSLFEPGEEDRLAGDERAARTDGVRDAHRRRRETMVAVLRGVGAPAVKSAPRPLRSPSWPAEAMPHFSTPAARSAVARLPSTKAACASRWSCVGKAKFNPPLPQTA